MVTISASPASHRRFLVFFETINCKCLETRERKLGTKLYIIKRFLTYCLRIEHGHLTDEGNSAAVEMKPWVIVLYKHAVNSDPATYWTLHKVPFQRSNKQALFGSGTYDISIHIRTNKIMQSKLNVCRKQWDVAQLGNALGKGMPWASSLKVKNGIELQMRTKYCPVKNGGNVHHYKKG